MNMETTNLSDLLAGVKKDKLEEETVNKDREAQKLRDAARDGDPYSQNEVGNAYFRKKKYKEAADMYAKAVKQGWEPAFYDLAWCYHHGLGVDLDYEEAIKLYKKYNETFHDPDSEREIGRCYEFGLNDITEARKWYRKAAEKDDVFARIALEQMDIVENDNSGPEEWFKKGERACWDITRKQYTIDGEVRNIVYYGLSQDPWRYIEAMRWWSKAAFKGHAQSQYNLALYMYQRGHGCPVSKAEALYWFTKAAENGYLFAQEVLIKKYGYGEGVEQDPRKAKKWWRKAYKPKRSFKEVVSRVLKPLPILLAIVAIVLVRRMDQMSYRSITEEEALEMAQEIKVALPDQEVTLLNSGETQKLKTGKTVKVLGVYKTKLNKGNSPRVYGTSQKYLIELPDGTRGYGPLMETAIGQLGVLAEGDTAVITAVKKLKKKPTVKATGNESRTEYAYTLEGHEGQYAREDIHFYFPQRVVYLADGLREEDFAITSDTIGENKKDFQKVKKFFLYDIRPITKKTGFFVFPKYQVWNEFYLQRWFRNLMIFVAYVVEILLIFVWIPRFIRKLKK